MLLFFPFFCLKIDQKSIFRAKFLTCVYIKSISQTILDLFTHNDNV